MSSASKRTARVAWLVPVLLLLLTGHQMKTSVDLAETRESGTSVWADVTRYDRSDRKDVTMVELDLVATLPDGSRFERTRLNLPYTIGHRVEKDSLLVHIQPGAAQEVVIDEIARTQISIARSNAVMALIAALMAFWGVFAWNRWLVRTTAPSA